MLQPFLSEHPQIESCSIEFMNVGTKQYATCKQYQKHKSNIEIHTMSEFEWQNICSNIPYKKERTKCHDPWMGDVKSVCGRQKKKKNIGNSRESAERRRIPGEDAFLKSRAPVFVTTPFRKWKHRIHTKPHIYLLPEWLGTTKNCLFKHAIVARLNFSLSAM